MDGFGSLSTCAPPVLLGEGSVRARAQDTRRAAVGRTDWLPGFLDRALYPLPADRGTGRLASRACVSVSRPALLPSFVRKLPGQCIRRRAAGSVDGVKRRPEESRLDRHSLPPSLCRSLPSISRQQKCNASDGCFSELGKNKRTGEIIAREAYPSRLELQGHPSQDK